MWNEVLGSINELPVERKSTKISEIVGVSNFGFEKRLLDAGEDAVTVCAGCIP